MSIEINAVDLNLAITQSTPTITATSSIVYVGSETFTYNQSAPSAEWSITHNLDRYPAVSIVDSGGNVVIGEVRYASSTLVVVTFASAFAGKAYLN